MLLFTGNQPFRIVSYVEQRVNTFWLSSPSLALANNETEDIYVNIQFLYYNTIYISIWMVDGWGMDGGWLGLLLGGGIFKHTFASALFKFVIYYLNYVMF